MTITARRMNSRRRALEREWQQARRRWRYALREGRVRFEREAWAAHRRLKQSLPGFLLASDPLSLVTAPLIYSMIVPIALLDLWITIYQRLSFPVYGIRPVRRSAYMVIDRHHLGYLNAIEKLNCAYCGYANGVFSYVREIVSRTEQYWCPIRHARRIRTPHRRYRRFVDYGDAEGYLRGLPALRRQLTDRPRRQGRQG